MKSPLHTAARRSAALLAIAGIIGCDATRSVESTPRSIKAETESHAPSFTATGTGTSAPSTNSIPLINASFEAGAYNVGWQNPGTPGQFVDMVSGWDASNGIWSVDLNGFNPGYVEQSFPTIPGVQYTVQFDMAGNPGNPQGVKTMVVSAGANSANYSFDTQGRSVHNMGWTPKTFVFTANSSLSKLRFQSTYVGNGAFPDAAQGAAIDNVRITWSPTPTTTTVSFGSGPFVYTGSAFTATASATPSGTPTITYSGDCTNPGSTCTATAKLAASGEYAASSATADITIEKAPSTTTVSFGSGPFVYNGSAFSATASVSTGGTATIAYTGDCTNAGSTCTATATFDGDATHNGSSATANITITKATTTTSVSFGSGPFIYNGSTFTATASVNPAVAGAATIAYTGECKFAGTCTATATFAGNGNYVGSSATTSITIKYPVASTGDQCKNGGWQYLTDDLGNPFKNQGDCVSFVATKGKNKGAG